MRFSKITRGFSLIEILVVLALVSIVMGLALPAWQHLSARSASQNLLSQLGTALRLARQQALLRKEAVSLCPSRDQQTCSLDWRDGLLVFVDSEQNGKPQGSEQILQVFQLHAFQGTLHWRAFPLSRPYYQFLPLGLRRYENGSFWYCESAHSKPAWALVLSQPGRMREVYPDEKGDIADGEGVLAC